jgi:hypothetical protein
MNKSYGVSASPKRRIKAIRFPVIIGAPCCCRSRTDSLPHVHPRRTPSLFGCNTPIILRRVESYYRVVGVGLVPGLMEGEALDQLAPDGPFQLEEIEPR